MGDFARSGGILRGLHLFGLEVRNSEPRGYAAGRVEISPANRGNPRLIAAPVGSSVKGRDLGRRRFRLPARRLVAVPSFSIGRTGPAAAR